MTKFGKLFRLSENKYIFPIVSVNAKRTEERRLDNVMRLVKIVLEIFLYCPHKIFLLFTFKVL